MRLRATPSFFIYKSGELVHRHSGAYMNKFTCALDEQLGRLPPGTFASKFPAGEKKSRKARAAQFKQRADQ